MALFLCYFGISDVAVTLSYSSVWFNGLLELFHFIETDISSLSLVIWTFKPNDIVKLLFLLEGLD